MGKISSGQASDDFDADIDMSPLIDCVFILLIFFIVTTVFVKETGVEVERPLVVSAEKLERNSLLIAITPEGNIMHGGRDIGVNGVQPLIKRELKAEQLPVIIQVDAGAKASMLYKVLSEAKLGGAVEVNVATRVSS